MKQFFTKKIASLSVLLILWVSVGYTQPTIDASIGTNEYGNSNTYNYVSGTPTWYMTWDDTYLYVAVMNANQTESATIYLDLDPLNIVNGGSNTNGSLAGASFDFMTPDLPFRADIALFAKNSYRQISQKNGAGGWNTIGSGNGAFSSTGDDYGANFVSFNDNGNGNGNDDRREFKVAWTRMGLASKPASFNFFAYISYDNSAGPNDEGIYADVPLENPNGPIGTISATPDMIRYFTVLSTSTANNPFQRNSYTHIGGNMNIGTIGVYDFTMNTNSTTITRNGGAWIITNLKIGNGTISGNPSDDITVLGDLLIETGASLTLSTTSGSDLYIAGNFTNNGTFNDNSRATFFNGTNGEQTIGGSTTTTFSYLIVDKTSGELKLDNNINIANFIDLDDATNLADINLNGFNITFGASAFVVEDLGNNKIIKDLTATSESNDGGALIFPSTTVDGTSTNLRGSGLYLRTTGGSYPVTFTRQHYRGGGINGGGGIKRIYKISGTPTISTTLRIYYATDELADITIDANTVLFRWTSANGWLKAGDANAGFSNGTNGSGYIEATNVTGFSDWTIASTTSPLPISLLTFVGKKLNDTQALLSWVTATETNNKGFYLEKSNQATDFQTVAFIDGAGNSNTTKSYHFTDMNFQASAYYRLRQVDFNGAFSYSPIIFMANETFTLYPNPIIDNITLNLSMKDTETAQIFLADITGKSIAQLTVTTDNASLLVSQQFQKLPKGIYLFRIHTPTKTWMEKIVKQ